MDYQKHVLHQSQLSELQPGLSELHYEAEDAESCCGSPTCWQAEEDLVCESSQQHWEDSRMVTCYDSSVVQPHKSQQQQQQQRETSACPQRGSDDNGAADFTQGDDFEALEPSMLLDDPRFDTYPGGVEAALADWEAAVSSKGAAAASSAAAAEASSSSCCNYAPQQQQVRFLQGLPVSLFEIQARIAACDQKIMQLRECARREQQQWAAAFKQQQQQCAGGHGVAAAAAAAKADAEMQRLYWQQHWHQRWQQHQQQAALQQQCPFAAFKGDVVGAVLAGLMPAPSSDSNDDLMEPLAFQLPCC